MQPDMADPGTEEARGMKTLYKNGTVFFVRGPEGQVKEMEILLDGGPLCIANIWDFERKRMVLNLFWIYFKTHGIHFGPFYASLSLAERDMKKALKIQSGMWDQGLEWLARQAWLQEWIDKNMGNPDYLIGGVWAKD